MAAPVAVKQERHDEAEIRELANKIMEANKAKMAAANNPRTIGAGIGQGQIAGFFGMLNKKPNHIIKADKDEDFGRFGWTSIGKQNIPYIFRLGEKYCSVKMVEMKVLCKYLNYLHQDIYSCTNIRSFYISDSESKLLTEINSKHCENQFGKEMFTQRDLVVTVSDVIEFYNFLDICYTRLIQGGCGPRDRCGFIRINKESVVPFTIRAGKKYVPLFYFEGETDNLRLKAEELEGWDLAYLKFCCKVQGIRNELFANETCEVISLDDIRSYFPQNTDFEDYWPEKVVDSQLLVTNPKSAGYNGLWTKQPTQPPPPLPKPQSPAQQTTTRATRNSAASTASALSQGALAGMTPAALQAWHNQQMLRQMGLGGMTQAISTATTQSQSTRGSTQRSSNANVHQYYNSSALPMALTQNQLPPPLVRATVAQNTLGAGTFTNTGLTPQNVTSLMMFAQQGLMPPPGTTIDYTTAAQAVRHAAVAAQRSAQQSQQPAMLRNRMSSRQSQQNGVHAPPPLIPVNGNSSSRYDTAASQSTYLVPNSDVVDLSSPPRSPATRQNNVAKEAAMKTVMENDIKYHLIDEVAYNSNPPPQYKLSRVLVDSVMAPCINMKPYSTGELLITLDDIVSNFFPKLTSHAVRGVLKLLNVNAYRGNSLQLQVLQEAGKLKKSDQVAFYEVKDIVQFMPQLKYMCKAHEEQMSREKRQRVS